MVAPSPLPLTLKLEDADLDAAELDALTRSIQTQIQRQDLTETIDRPVVPVEPIEEPTRGGDWVSKGEEKQPGILQMEVNLENINKLVSWLYQRLAGKTTKAKLSFGEGVNKVEFEFEGNNQKDLAATMEDVSKFIEKVQQIQDGKRF
jgi:hypothetical protein